MTAARADKIEYKTSQTCGCVSVSKQGPDYLHQGAHAALLVLLQHALVLLLVLVVRQHAANNLFKVHHLRCTTQSHQQ